MACDPEQWGPGTFGVGCCSTIFLIISIFLFGFSFDTLDPTEMGLMYDANLCKLDITTVYNQERNQGGRWWTGLGSHFISFPKTVHVIKFNSEPGATAGDITGKTLDGASVDMGISFQYSLQRTPESLSKLYLKYGERYDWFIQKYARQVTRDVLAEYLVTALWEKRAEVGSKIRSAMGAELARRYCKLEGFQLLNLDIPNELKSAIVNTTVEFQNIEKAQFQLEAEQVRARTQRLTAEQDAAITVVNARAAADAFLLDVGAKALALNVTVQSQLDAYNDVKTRLGLTPATLMTYVWLDTMLATEAKEIIIAASQPNQTYEA